MGLKTRKTNGFNARYTITADEEQGILSFKGGFVCIEDKWLYFNDIRINIKEYVDTYLKSTSRRIFNNYGDSLYVLIAFDKSGKVEVIPSLAYNNTSFGSIKVFPDLSGKIPLSLVLLKQDGSAGLTGIADIDKCDIEIYRGYGNYTLRGPEGAVGPKGITGYQGCTGQEGVQGFGGLTGAIGYTGLSGGSVQGVTGVQGPEGYGVTRHIPDQTTFIQDVVDPTENTWNDVVDDTVDGIQDVVNPE